MFIILGADGKEYGPVTADKAQAWITGGRATLQTKARRDGETEWKTLGEFAEFGTAAPGAPPPAPITIASMTGTPALTAAVPAVELEPAGRGARLLAQIIDGLIGIIVVLPGCVLLIMGGGNKSGALSLSGMGLMGLGVLALLIVQLYLLTTRGQTIGKKLMKVKIVAFDDDSNPGFVKAVLLRVVVNGIIGAIPLLGYIYALVDICFIFRDDRRCIHDLIAGTKVVKA
jgi:uncharacterized RDD family membrane protein YckC